ncbi:hypothetical protein ES708_06309 [subsurface metagenome]
MPPLLYLQELCLAESEGEGQWGITDEGRGWLESGGGKETGKKDERKETAETVLHDPTSSDPLERSFERHPKGNFTDYYDFCFNLGDEYLKQYMLKKQGYK